MKGRYPKHYWPENPAEAEATKLTKKKMAAVQEAQADKQQAVGVGKGAQQGSSGKAAGGKGKGGTK